MKNLLIFIIICVGAWQFFLKDNIALESSTKATVDTFPNSGAMQTLAKPKVTFKCDGRQYCSQMNSYEEAKYFIQHCPNTKMDGDNDGIPCEKQFNKW